MLSLTIFTPTYNREKEIVRTYNSLLRQSVFDFEWLIVDDGSTDETEKEVKKWIENSPFLIRYIKQKNAGKYRAYNQGLLAAKGELFFCVDSDDWLPDLTVERIIGYAKSLKGNLRAAGIIGLKVYPNMAVMGTTFSLELDSASLFDLEMLGQNGERSIIFRTDIAKQYLFPEETNEKFMTESVIYDRYYGEYVFCVENEAFTICEYQENGLSSNPRKLMFDNPAGYKLYFAQRIDLPYSFLTRVKNAVSYNIFSKLYKGNAFCYRGKYRFLVKLLFPVGCVFAWIYKKKYR